jgi:hypothetical protein
VYSILLLVVSYPAGGRSARSACLRDDERAQRSFLQQSGTLKRIFS